MAVPGGGPAGIFISYRPADAIWPARWLADRLARHFGAGVMFRNVDSIEAGDDFAANIEAAVGACSVLLAVIGPQWLTVEGGAERLLDDPQDWVRLEIEAAFSREVRIVPVLLNDTRMPAADEMPPSLRGLARRQAVSFSPASRDISRLVSVLETALAQGEESRQQAETRSRNAHNPEGQDQSPPGSSSSASPAKDLPLLQAGRHTRVRTGHIRKSGWQVRS